MSWTEALRDAGLRVTPQRHMVLQALERLQHATSDEILAEVTEYFPTTALSTIYRVLESLEDAGLVGHSHLSHAAVTYYLVDPEAHLHLVCEVCQAVDCLGPSLANDLAKQLAAQHRFELNTGHLTLHGLCGDCTERVRGLEGHHGVP
jgi:Fur family ferric uptake transcriptional regulator